MHFEFLVEDQSGQAMLELLIPKLLADAEHTVNIHSYRGIGRIPKGLKPGTEARKRILLDQLPKLLGGYGKVFQGYGDDYPAAVVVVCDLDDRDRAKFEAELRELVQKINPCPRHAFCLAIEEGEAWYLGDLTAVTTAYPKAKQQVLRSYVPDSICGTWEVLAEAVYPGGAAALSSEGWQRVGEEKSVWARTITPHIEPGRNLSPSFRGFVATVTGMVS